MITLAIIDTLYPYRVSLLQQWLFVMWLQAVGVIRYKKYCYFSSGQAKIRGYNFLEKAIANKEIKAY